ncbi:hypothetical protein BDZ89DRAFT_1064453 [Hymenopellis radicata]|nr:hypothetical protein BDZ89DRAFT_1064453 [Hymenopellis radicata]
MHSHWACDSYPPQHDQLPAHANRRTSSTAATGTNELNDDDDLNDAGNLNGGELDYDAGFTDNDNDFKHDDDLARDTNIFEHDDDNVKYNDRDPATAAPSTVTTGTQVQASLCEDLHDHKLLPSTVLTTVHGACRLGP